MERLNNIRIGPKQPRHLASYTLCNEAQHLASDMLDNDEPQSLARCMADREPHHILDVLLCV